MPSIRYAQPVFTFRSHKCPTCRAPLEMDRNTTKVRCQYCGAQAHRKAYTRILVPAKPAPAPAAPARQPSHAIRPAPPVHNYSWLIAVPMIALSFGGIYFAYYQANSQGHTQTSTRVRHTSTTTQQRPTPNVQPKAKAKAKQTTPTKVKPRTTAKTQKKSSTPSSKHNKKKREPQTSEPKAALPTNVLTKPVAKRVLRRVHMLHCAGSGDVTVSIAISPSGEVSNTSTKTSDDEQAARCVADTVGQLRFPVSTEGLKTSHRYRW